MSDDDDLTTRATNAASLVAQSVPNCVLVVIGVADDDGMALAVAGADGIPKPAAALALRNLAMALESGEFA